MLAVVDAHGRRPCRPPPRCAAPEEIEETVAFLEWLRDGHFILLGARAYAMEETPEGPTVHVRADSGLGVLRDDDTSRFARPTPVGALPEFLRERLVATGDLLVIGKTNRRSQRASPRAHGRRRRCASCGRTARSRGCCA